MNKLLNTFTNAIVREIGRNIGKAASNKLLGDAHSTPYRRVGEKTSSKQSVSKSRGVTDDGSGGRKSGNAISRGILGYRPVGSVSESNNEVIVSVTGSENHLDKLISTVQIKGEIATFNSAQNIYNAYFQLVQEALNDSKLNESEIGYLIDQYYRAKNKLNEISKALIELNAHDKSEMVVEKIISMNDFMKEVDNNFEKSSLVKKEVDKRPLKFFGIAIIIALVLTIYSIAVYFSEVLFLTPKGKWIFIVSTLFVYSTCWIYYGIYDTAKKKVLTHNIEIDRLYKLKEKLTEAANSL